MKRLLTILLTLSLILSLTACGSKADDSTPDDPAGQEQEQDNTDTQQPDEETKQDEPDGAQEDDQSEPEQPAQQPEKAPEQKTDTKTEEKPAQKPTETPEQKPAETPAPEQPKEEQPKEEPKEEQPASTGDPLSILSTVWKSYSEDEKFPSTEPLSVDVSDTSSLSYQLTFPEGDASLINSAASLMHMLNMNTFTCGAFHAADVKDVSTLASDLRSAIQGKQWMCGFPEKLVIVTMDQYVISMYGNEDLINTFRDKLLASYSSASVVYDEGIG